MSDAETQTEEFGTFPVFDAETQTKEFEYMFFWPSGYQAPDTDFLKTDDKVCFFIQDYHHLRFLGTVHYLWEGGMGEKMGGT